MKISPSISRRLYRIILWISLAACVLLLWKLNARILNNPDFIPADDFGQYWGAARLNYAGHNPYYPDAVQELINAIIGRDDAIDIVPIMYTPPWTILLYMPFGLLDYSFGRLLWLLLNVAILMVCSHLIWRHYHGNPRLVWLAWIIGFLFGPTISVLEKGQITPWVLAGIVGFLLLVEQPEKDWLTGFLIALITIKPQIVYLFWLAWLLWICDQRRWKILLGCGLTMVLATLPPLIFNPSLLAQYLDTLLHNSPIYWITPTIGGFLRQRLGAEHFWLQFLPSLVGAVWMIWYWLRRRRNWQWSTEMPILLFASILTASYGWTYDQVVLLAAVLPAFVGVIQAKQRAWLTLAGFAYLIINALDLFLHQKHDDSWFIWLAPAFLVWYLAAQWIARKASRVVKSAAIQ